MQKTIPANLTPQSLQGRVLILDGAMGTMLRPAPLTPAPCDLLNLSQPEQVQRVHELYLESGASILRTNTFNSNSLALRDLGEPQVRDLNAAGVRIARKAAASAGKSCFIAGAMGPIPYGEGAAPEAYYAQSAALIEAGADLLVAETITQPLTVAAVLEALARLSDEKGRWIPAIVSLTPMGTLPVSAFLERLTDYPLLALGLNCMSVHNMAPILEVLSAQTRLPLCVYPSAGLPDSKGRYPDEPSEMVSIMHGLAVRGLVNVAGGCCGTTPAFIRELAAALEGV